MSPLAIAAIPAGAHRRTDKPAVPPFDKVGNRWPLAAATALVLLYVAAACTEPGQRVDEAAMNWLSSAVGAHGWAEFVLTQVSAPTVAAAVVTLATITAAMRGRTTALIGVATVGAILVAAEVLKLGLDRPNFLEDGAGNSFPSGHVAAVAGLAAAVLIAVPAAKRRRVAYLAVGPVVAVSGLATVLLQWHRPSDVLGAVLLAAAIGGLASRVADRVPETSLPAREPTGRHSRTREAPAAGTPAALTFPRA